MSNHGELFISTDLESSYWTCAVSALFAPDLASVSTQLCLLRKLVGHPSAVTPCPRGAHVVISLLCFATPEPISLAELE